jgi:hypothetical protein
MRETKITVDWVEPDGDDEEGDAVASTEVVAAFSAARTAL